MSEVHESSSTSKQVAIVMDADTARVIRVETVDETGTHHELPNDEKAMLVKLENDGGLERLMEQAFEAGIACVLDGDARADTKSESAEDAELRHRLLAPLIERSGVRHLMDTAVLNRAILSTLIDRSMK